MQPHVLRDALTARFDLVVMKILWHVVQLNVLLKIKDKHAFGKVTKYLYGANTI